MSNIIINNLYIYIPNYVYYVPKWLKEWWNKPIPLPRLHPQPLPHSI